MNVWLVNPRTDGMIATELPGFVSKEVGRFPPLGLLYLAGALRQAGGHAVRVLDMPARDMSYAGLAEDLRRDRPGLVGITAITHNLVEVLRAAECVKQALPSAHVCVGGPHVDAFPAETLALAPVDSTVWGEGEEVFPRLVEAVAAGRDPDGLPGVSWKDNGRPRPAPAPAPPIADLDRLPLPARDLVDGRDYYYVLGRRATFTTAMSSRGCPYRCVFCSTPRGRCRARSPAGVVDEMAACLAAGAEEIHFVDDTFNAAPDRLAAVSREILNRGLRARWSIRARINTIEEEGLRLARQAGCVRVHFGVETGTDEGLRVLRKDLTTARIEEAFRLTRRCGLVSAAYFLIGCPHEKTRADVLRTLAFARRLDPDFAMFNILAIYPKTELFDMAVARGLIAKDYWADFVRRPDPAFRLRFWQESFTPAELGDLLRLAYRRFYFRPRVVWRNLRSLGSLEDLKHKAAAALAMLAGRQG
jgi:radical SAM superfamily enzyme YgiQ (UPF0313 family)